MRICEICGHSEQEHIHRQHFLYPDQPNPIHYDVVSCTRCGFSFASNIPDQTTLNHFYHRSENHVHMHLPAGLARIHDEFFIFIQQHLALSPSTRVLDIGSGMGHFLNRFKNIRLPHLTGIEPSTAAARLGREVYGLSIEVETIDTFCPPDRFNLITMCGVLEHIADLRSSVQRIYKLLDIGGFLFVAVPDAASFGGAPPTEAFLEFALEHINFFSKVSLDNLLRESGFEAIQVELRGNDFYSNSYLLALYRKVSAAATEVAIQPDRIATPSLRSYVAHSLRKQSSVAAMASQLVASGESLIIWGAGSLTSRLLCDTQLVDAQIVAVIDSNKALHGRHLLGFTIVGPEALIKHPGTTVLIASTTYASDITEILTGEFGWRGKVITLIDEQE